MGSDCRVQAEPHFSNRVLMILTLSFAQQVGRLPSVLAGRGCQGYGITFSWTAQTCPGNNILLLAWCGPPTPPRPPPPIPQASAVASATAPSSQAPVAG